MSNKCDHDPEPTHELGNSSYCTTNLGNIPAVYTCWRCGEDIVLRQQLVWQDLDLFLEEQNK